MTHTLHVNVSEVTTEWCDECATPSVVTYTATVLSSSGVHTLTAHRCARCRP